MENERDPYFYQVYTLGNWGVTGDVIFTNWKTETLPDPVPGESRLGLDFGFASDPCGFVLLHYDRKRRRIYVLSEVYEKGLTNPQLFQRIASIIAACHPIACDSAEPKSIAELRTLGLRAYPVKKGPDSVVHGIQWLRQQEIILSPACPHLKDELSRYQWQHDKDGCALPQPRDKDNHLIDAMRYALQNDMDRRVASTASKQSLGL